MREVTAERGAECGAERGVERGGRYVESQQKPMCTTHHFFSLQLQTEAIL